jgi:hypothetical protein
MTLTVLGSADDEEDILKMVNASAIATEARKAYDEVFQWALNECSNERTKQIVTDAWRGKGVSSAEYKSQYSEKDNEEAYSIIMSLVSMGFG